MSLLDDILPEKSHEDVRATIQSDAERIEEDPFENNYVIRIRCRIKCDGRFGKNTVKKGNEICRYIEDIFYSWDSDFRLLKTRSTTMINHVTAATFVISLVIGFNKRQQINQIMKMLLKVSICIVHFKPEEGFRITITDPRIGYEKNRISAYKLFNADTYRFLLVKFNAFPSNHVKVPRSVRRPYYVIQKYYDKNKIDDSDEHFIPYIPNENEIRK